MFISENKGDFVDEKDFSLKENKEKCSSQDNVDFNVSDHEEKFSSDLLDLKDREILFLKSEIDKLKQQEHDSLLRFQAEIINIRRRSTLDVENVRKFSLENFVSNLLPVIDNLERSLDVINKSCDGSNDDYGDNKYNNNVIKSLIEGVNLTLKSFLNVVCKFGVEVINEVGVVFDPKKHQAMSILNVDNYDSNYVTSILQKGYLLNGRLIRPAMVTVSDIDSSFDSQEIGDKKK